ncbi:acyl carrier protein [Natronocella acetinitrilica]|uniref:Acyl carrier protein n=1 Tax=Natronocella acetinitrilica TaxID=414046 RepID=A0AAE3G674_9GAMM|nr:acyl carrier protein [Natronocella acetinitrilica]MCP1675794.1 acyl carrier protein [Natronocella acetinitrilica]
MHDIITSTFADIFGLDEASITDDMTPETVELWDSLNHLRLITALEEAFGFRLSMSDIEYMMGSVARVREVVDRHAAASAVL